MMTPAGPAYKDFLVTQKMLKSCGGARAKLAAKGANVLRRVPKVPCRIWNESGNLYTVERCDRESGGKNPQLKKYRFKGIPGYALTAHQSAEGMFKSLRYKDHPIPGLASVCRKSANPRDGVILPFKGDRNGGLI